VIMSRSYNGQIEWKLTIRCAPNRQHSSFCAQRCGFPLV
jgi:hypothetical protein